MKRISVVGIAGSGKTTLATALGERLGLPTIELDSVVHAGPDWQRLDADELVTRLAALAEEPRWVIDGYLGALTERLVWPRADTVIWIDLPRRVVLLQALCRSLRRILRREVLWGGNKESIRDLVSWSPERSVLRWIWTQHEARRERFIAASADSTWASTEFVRLCSRREIASFVSSVETGR